MRRYWYFVVGMALVMILLIFGIFKVNGDKRMTSFWFAEEDNPVLHADADGIIEGNIIQVVLENVDDIRHLIPTFTHTGKRVGIDGVKQASKKTANDFSSEVIYTVTASNGSAQDYTVLVYTKDEKGLWPPLPAPPSYDGAIPERSREIMVERAEFTNIDFAPIVNTAVAETRIREEKNIFTGKWRVTDEAAWNKEIELARFSDQDDRRIRLIREGQPAGRSELEIERKIPNRLLVIPQREHYRLQPLQEKPQLQVVRYWQLTDPQAGVYKLAPHEGTEIHTQVKVGVNEASRKAFAAVIGASGDREVNLFNLLVNSQFKQDYLPSGRPAVESILPIDKIIQPSDWHRIVLVYKLVHEIRIIDAKGQLYTDPNYQFDPDSLRPLLYVDSKKVTAKVYTFKKYKP